MSVKNIIVMLILLSFGVCSCKKKCTTCSTVCYECVYLFPYQGKDSGIVCSEKIGSIDSFNSVLNTLEASGNRCYKISPDESYQYCDDNQAFMTAVQNVGFVCQ